MAKDLYSVLRQSLEAWCVENNAKLVINETSIVF
ncbi:hypothetical protein HY29_17565 [Hyphomonas beringensis]|uniref:Uncharacterized protein n=1 Tax=Hyphomonas beringensis TaxID=1280946 RepID=A0A062UAN7_9PROT|nr:hypothetical protein HY29_17565 [Hyphomonas beringensis]